MKNLIKTIEGTIYHCLHCFHSFNSKQAKSTRHLIDAVFLQRSLVLLLFILLLPIFSIVAQNQKAIKTHLQEDKVYCTPQLAGSSPTVKPTVVKRSIPNVEEKPSAALKEVRSSNNLSSSMTWPQLKVYMDASQQTLSDVTIYTGISDQCASQVVSDGNEMFVAFENFDTELGNRPAGSIKVYRSTNGGADWNYWDGIYNPTYHVSSPQIVIAGGYIVISYRSGGYLFTFRWRRSDGSSFSSSIPIPTVSVDEKVIDHRMVSDVEQYPLMPWFYMAYLFKQVDGTNKVMYSYSMDSAGTWEPYTSLGVSESELGVASIGLDYGRSGLYIAYLGTGADAGEIVIRKSTDLGLTWIPEQILPFAGPNKKVGPMVAAVGQRVAIVYQYDYNGTATNWKISGTGGDFDVNAVVSDDGGTLWREWSVGSSPQNEILPCVTTDADSNFYVSFIRDGQIRISMAGEELAFSTPLDSAGTLVSPDYFPSIFGSNTLGTKTAYIAWTGTSNGLDIFGANVVLRIPPLSPSALNANAVSSTQINLSWNDNSFDETEFRIYMGDGGTGSFSWIATVGSSITTYQVTGLAPSTQYDFFIRAKNDNGFSRGTNTASATTQSGGTTISPSAPTNLFAIAGNTKVTLTWNKNTEADFLRYRIYYGTLTSSTTPRDSTSGAATDTTKTITGLINGTTYYFRITAVNNAGVESGFSNEESSTPSAVVDVTPPSFTVSPYVTGVPVYVNASGNVVSSPLPQVNASASDNGSGMSKMQVAYRNNMDQQWSYSQKVSGSAIDYQIPVNSFSYNNKPMGVNFMVGAWDKADNVAWSPYTSIDVQLGPQVIDQSNLTMPAASQLSNKTTAYRIVSVPYDLPNKQPANLLSNFGSHMDNNISYARWRFQRWFNGQYQDYDQFSQTNTVVPSAAFFFIVRDQGSQIAAKGASVVRSDDMYNTSIQLKNGWNLIGNPFTVPYPVDSLEFLNTSIIGRAYYNGSGIVSGWEITGSNVAFIQPWQGIAIKVNSDGTMKFPSVGQRSGLPKLKSAPSAKRSEPTQAENLSNWMIPINAYRSDIDMRCEGGSVGMVQGASEGDDQYDVYIPPFVGDKNIAVYYNNSEGAMLRDIRPLNEDGGVWEMCVVTGDAGVRVKLQLGDKLNLPNPVFEAYLIDTDQKMAHNLKEVQSLEINSGNGVRNFRVVVGKKSFVEGNNAGVALTPSGMKLYANYPNPFNPETVIRYTVPDASASYTVTLKIFNVLGQEIATLVNEQKQSGYYEVKWNALQQSSGIYFYQLSITDGSKKFQEIKKMVLMK